MKSRMLSLILCFGMIATSIPSVEVNASIETARLFNIKSSVLGASQYDGSYDTNEDGNVNVFDVIRINKEVVQGESYNDLKNKVAVLEQQIQALIEQLANKEELKGNEFTDADKAKLDELENYDDTEIRDKLEGLHNYDDTDLKEGKVDKEEGKSLSSNDFTDEDKSKLDELSNYDDTEIKKQLEALHNYDDSEIREKLNSLENYDDTEIKKQLESLHNYDDTEIREKLDNLHNYDDTEIRERLDSLENYDDTALKEGKVDKEEGKGLSSNDFTDEDKAKLDGLKNYDDTEIRNQIKNLDETVLKNANKVTFIVDKNGSGDYTSLTECIMSHQNIGFDVYVRSGVYDLIEEYKTFYGNDVFDATDFNKEGLRIANGTRVFMDSDATVTFEYEGNNQRVIDYFSPFIYQSTGGEIHGGRIICKNCRYAIHDDVYNVVDHDTRLTEGVYIEYTSDRNVVIGGGLGKSSYVTLKNCVVINTAGAIGYGVFYHNTVNEGKSFVIIDGCYFNGDIVIEPFGESQEKSRAIVINNKCNAVRKYQPSEALYDNFEMYEWNNVTN